MAGPSKCMCLIILLHLTFAQHDVKEQYADNDSEEDLKDTSLYDQSSSQKKIKI
jgi:hypothetical protein